MYLFQLLLPLYDNSGVKFDPTLYNDIRGDLIERFGGITAYSRAPAHGLWQDSEELVRDDLVIYEVMSERLDRRWWRVYRQNLEARFRQQALVIRAQRITLL